MRGWFYDLSDRARIALIAAAVLVLVLGGAYWWLNRGDGGPSAGTVVSRSYDDPDRWMQCIPIGAPGKAGYNSCGSQVWHTSPARWLLTISDGQRTREVSVDETTYHATPEGAWFDSEAA